MDNLRERREVIPFQSCSHIIIFSILSKAEIEVFRQILSPAEQNNNFGFFPTEVGLFHVRVGRRINGQGTFVTVFMHANIQLHVKGNLSVCDVSHPCFDTWELAFTLTSAGDHGEGTKQRSRSSTTLPYALQLE